jgi:hypothetical protein
MAQRRLRHIPGQQKFLARCVEAETSAANIMRLVYGSVGRDLHVRLNPHVIRLLEHEEETVRCDALAFIGFNSHRAPVWQIEFTHEVFWRVVDLSRSKSAEERAWAVYALTDMRNRDPAAVRARIFELAEDKSADVRWRLPQVLGDQLERPDVQALLAKLLRDESALVRYFTIITLGPEKHVEELRALAAGSNKQVAEYAAGQLRKVSPKKP